MTEVDLGAGIGTYLYAIGADTGRPPPQPTGLLGAPVRTFAEAGLVAYVGPVPLAEFGEEALRRNLEDLGWLEATARVHHRVVEVVAREGPVAPVRLVTVYRGEGQVRDLLRRHAEEFAALLDRVRGRSEWGVKVYAVAPPEAPAGSGRAAGGARAVGSGAGAGGERPGAAYLKRRRSGLRSREEAWRRAAARAEHVDAVLSALAVATRHHRPQNPQLSGRTDWMVLNGAYLVDDDRGEEFTATVERLREPQLDVELTGPWAPYSFTIADPGREAGA